MPFSLNSCLCSSTLSIASFSDFSSTPTLSTQNQHSSDGYITTSEKIKASDIKPPASCLHPKLRMSVQEYNNYKELMSSLPLPEKKVRFTDGLLVTNKNSTIEKSGAQKSVASPSSALFDDNTDYVSFEEHEPFRLARLKHPEGAILCQSDSLSTNKYPEKSALSTVQAVSADYDIPRKYTILSDYDIPRKQAIPVDYNIPRKQAIPADYDIPRKQAISTDYDIPRKHSISVDQGI